MLKMPSRLDLLLMNFGGFWEFGPDSSFQISDLAHTFNKYSTLLQNKRVCGVTHLKKMRYLWTFEFSVLLFLKSAWVFRLVSLLNLSQNNFSGFCLDVFKVVCCRIDKSQCDKRHLFSINVLTIYMVKQPVAWK